MATIVIDPGHGGSDPGAVYFGRRESDDNLRMALRVGQLLANCGHRIIYTRSGDTFVSLTDRNRISNNANADAFVSIHRNASINPAANGLENYVRVGANARARTLAMNTFNNLLQSSGLNNRGFHERDFQVLRFTHAPAQLLELGFMSNVRDNQLFDQNFEANARAIANGITAVFGCGTGGTPTPPTTPRPPTTPPPSPGFDRNAQIRVVQTRLNRDYGAGLTVDGVAGPLTRRALIRAYQTELNRQFNAGLPVTGVWGPLTRAATRVIRRGDRGNLVWILQAALLINGQNISADGVFGPATEAAVRAFQTARGLTADGVAGPNTFATLFS